MLDLKKTVLILSLLTIIYTPWVSANEILKGLEYKKVTTPAKQTIHVLEVDPSYLNITAAHAKEKALGRETVSTIAKRHKAIAAINGGFFKSGELIDGLPAGILKIQGHWYGIAYRTRGAIGWSNQLHTVLIDRIQTKTNIFLNHRKFPVFAVNQPGLINKTILYTDAYGKLAGSLQNGYDIVIENNQIISFEASGKTPIPKGGFVYSIGSKAKCPNSPIDIGSAATVNIEVTPQFLKENYLAWQMVDNVIGGSPVLIMNGKLIKDFSSEKLRSNFIKERYARTAVGLLEDGNWVFVVVEQSALTGSPGMTIPELATFMYDLGCEYALNLDGGGSSTLYINNAVINHPEGDEENDYGWSAVRPVSDAILIMPKK